MKNKKRKLQEYVTIFCNDATYATSTEPSTKTENFVISNGRRDFLLPEVIYFQHNVKSLQTFYERNKHI
jgi:hypothetical protein